jgi:hypothetical protein
MGGFGRNDLSNAGWALAEAAGQGLHVGELVVNGLRKLDATLLVEAKGFLEMGEHSLAARDCKGHAAKLAEQLVPLLGCDTASSAEKVEQLVDTRQPMRGEFNRTANCVNQPTEDSFERRPACIAFEHLLDRSRLLARDRVGGI